MAAPDSLLARAVEARLDDGTQLLFRPIRPDDKERLQEGLKRLSPASRYRRFFRDVTKFTEDQLRYLTEVDFVDHFAWIAILPERPGEPGVGVARWIRLKNEADVAEAAVTVVDNFHNRGIGSALFYLAARSAAERGVRSFRAWVLGENTQMLALLKEMGALPGRWESGVLELTVPLPENWLDAESSPAPTILRAAAEGQIHGRLRADDPAATELH